MLTFLLTIPLELRLAGCFVLGLILGTLVNVGIYSLAWNARSISPWLRRHQNAPPRRWPDFIPLAGWLTLRREASIHGRGFWIRPLLLELCCGLGLAALYWWEMTGHLAPPFASRALAALPATTHAQFLAHATLIALMLVATFIDFDEQTIPDSITVPGAILGLLFAALWPHSLLPQVFPGPPPIIMSLLLTAPAPWLRALESWRYLLVGCVIIAIWSAALIPARATLRYGLVKGTVYYVESIRRHFQWPWYALLAANLMVGIAVVWYLGGPRWQALLTSLIGLAFGGGLVWAVRIVGRISLQREAMGFGDVTLMAMIGAFLGWQAALMVFFLSPVAALVIAVSQYALTRRNEIAFGPYLSLSALFVIVAWTEVWDFVKVPFELGTMIPLLVGACLLMMMGMLMFWRFFKELVLPEKDEDAEKKEA